MLRQRNIGQGHEVVGEGIFIGDVEEPVRSSKEKIIGQSEGSLWKYLSVILIVLTVASIGLNIYQFTLIAGHQKNIQELDDKHQNVHAEWTADRNSVEECRSEMHKMETHMNNRETEKTELEKEVTRLKRTVDNGGVTENPHVEHVDHHEGDTPPTPHPEQGYPTPPHHQELEEQQRQDEELRLQQEIQRQQEEVMRQQEAQRQQEELERQQEELRQQQEQQRQEEEARQQQEQQQRQQQEQEQIQQHQQG